jgi:Phage gp6-like head-tail connector protein
VANNLTTLQNVSTWLGLSTPTDNQLLERLISQASRVILAYLQRPNIFQQTYTDTLDGSGSERQFLPAWPVLSVSSLAIGTHAVAASPSYGQVGYTLHAWNGFPPGNPQWIDVFGLRFHSGTSNIAVTYTAGYAVQNEPQTVPSTPSYQVTVNAPYGNWAVDQGVTYANGTALTAVTNSPSVGQYSVTAGTYSFNSGDAGASILISYSYVPFDIEQVCIELVAERYRYKARIGEKSKTLGGQETTSYLITDLTPSVKLALAPYRRMSMV